jgi:hypothetical protein
MRLIRSNLRSTRVMLPSSHVESALLGLLSGVSSSSVLHWCSTEGFLSSDGRGFFVALEALARLGAARFFVEVKIEVNGWIFTANCS